MGTYQLYELDESTTTHINLIDGQHRELFKSFNNVFKALALAKDTKEMVGILNLVDACVKGHLSSEEELMEKASFPKIEAHKKAHEVLLGNISKIIRETEQKGVTSHLAEVVKETVGDWFFNHIKVMDMQYVPFVKDKSAS